MNDNLKQVLVIILSVALGFILYKILKVFIFAVLLSVAIIIAYNIINAMLGEDNDSKF